MRALRSIDARFKLAFLAVFAVVALHVQSPVELGLCLAVALGCALGARLRAHDVAGPLRGFLVIVAATAIAQLLSVQTGPPLVALGPLAITANGVWQTLRMLGVLIALLLVSVAFMRCTTSAELIGALAWLLEPLRRLGVDVSGPLLSLSVTMRFAPVLVGEFRQMRAAQLARQTRFDGSPPQRLAAYSRLFAPLVRSSWRHADTLAASLSARCFGCCEHPATLKAPRSIPANAACLIATLALAALPFIP